MQLIRGLHHLIHPLPASVVTLGNFDGVHLGHQQLVSELKREAKLRQVPSVVITFEPQPKEFFAIDHPVPRLMRLPEKYVALRALDCDYLCCLRFNAELASLTPHRFVQNILVEKLGMKGIVLGFDFRFGAKRQGDCALLEALGRELHFSVTQIPPVLFDHEPISSTRIRLALAQGQMVLAASLLGRPFRLRGKVSYGQQKGRALGFPTANIHLHRLCVPVQGVFVIVAMIRGQRYPGVANVGVRPTFAGDRVLLEVHLFDFNQVIYGETIEVDFLHKLRDEKRFDSFGDLLLQIKQDVQLGKAYFIHVSN